MPELRTFFVSVEPESEHHPPGYIGTMLAPSAKEAAGMYAIQTQDPAMFVPGRNLELRVQEEGEPNYDRATCWNDAEGLHVKMYGREDVAEKGDEAAYAYYVSRGGADTMEVHAPCIEDAVRYFIAERKVIPRSGGTEMDVMHYGAPWKTTAYLEPDGHIRVHVRAVARPYVNPDSASNAIENMMTPLDPSANAVSEAGIMTNSDRSPGVYVDPDLRVENPIVPHPPPHPWTVFRVYSDDDIAGPTLVLAMSFNEALSKAEARGMLVKSVARVDFDESVEIVSDF